MNYRPRVRNLFFRIKLDTEYENLFKIIRTLLRFLSNFTNGKHLRIINRELGIFLSKIYKHKVRILFVFRKIFDY